MSVSSIKAHRSMLSVVFCFKLPELGDHHVLRNLIRSFAIERPRRPPLPPSWDLDIALHHVMSSAYEPLGSLSLQALTKNALFLVALTTAKRVGELQALSKCVSSVGDGLVVSYLPHFVAKMEHADVPFPRSFRVCALREFSGDLEDGSLLCPVHALRAYLHRTKSAVARASTLFVLPRSPSHAFAKNAVSFFLARGYFGCWSCQGR